MLGNDLPDRFVDLLLYHPGKLIELFLLLLSLLSGDIDRICDVLDLRVVLCMD